MVKKLFLTVFALLIFSVCLAPPIPLNVVRRFELTNWDWTTQGFWTFDSLVTTNNGIFFPDDSKAMFGNTASAYDMALYSDGTNFVIQQAEVNNNAGIKFDFKQIGSTKQVMLTGQRYWLGTWQDRRIAFWSGIDIITNDLSQDAYFYLRAYDGIYGSQACLGGVALHSSFTPYAVEFYTQNADMIFSCTNEYKFVVNFDKHDNDFIIHADTTYNVFYVDAGTGYVGIRDSTPEAELDVNGTILIEGAGTGFFKDGSDNLCLYDANADTLTLDNILLADGTKPLTANWDVGAYQITASNFVSDIATGTSPYGCTSTTLNTNLNADMLDGKHVGTSGNTVPLLDGVNTWTGTNRYKEHVTISGNAKNDAKDLLIRSGHRVGFNTWLPTKIQFFDQLDNRGSIWYMDYSSLGVDNAGGLHLKSETGITLNANDGSGAITLNGLTVWGDDLKIGLGKTATGTERFELYANDNNGYLNPSCWGIACVEHPDSFVYNENQEDTDFIMNGSGGACFVLDAGVNNISINAAAVSAHYDLMLAGDGVLGLKETATPTADANYGKVYCKNDDKLYFQDGAGAEHEVATQGWSGTFTATEGVVTVTNGIITDVDWD